MMQSAAQRSSHSKQKGREHESRSEVADTAWPFAAAFQRTQSIRRVRWTELGYIGTVTYNTEECDLVVPLAGSCMPFVLRSRGRFQILGDCYTHRTVDGELICIAANTEALPADRLTPGIDSTQYSVNVGEGQDAVLQDTVMT